MTYPLVHTGGNTKPVVNIMATLTPETALDARFTEFNIRQDTGHFVRLHDHATKRLESYVRSFGSTLAGGILLGTVDLAEHWSITVKDFTPVLCEHRRDGRSSFVDCPAQCFKNAIRRANQGAKGNRTIVGYYRSHARPEFCLEKEDHDLARKYFAHDGRFLLLIKPSPAGYATGVFYLSIEGQLDSERSSVEFPISLKELGAEGPSEQEELERLAGIPSEPIAPEPEPIKVSVAAPPAPVVPVVAPVVQATAPAPAAPQVAHVSSLSEQFWKGAAAAAILLGSVFAVRSYRAPSSSPEPAIARPAQVAPASSAIPTNPEPARNQAKTPAPAVSSVPATPPEIRRQDPPAASSPVKTSPAPRVEPQKFVLPAQKKASPAPSVLANPPEIPTPGMALSIPTLVTPAVPAPALPVNPASSTSVAPGVPAPVSPAPQPVRNAPASTPAATTPQGPLSPPHVVLQASPVVPETVKRKLRGDVMVRVLVDVDANGKVVNAVSVTQSSKMTQSLIGLAVEAARQSHFEPGKQGDKKVAGQATLQFRFEGEVIRLPVQPSIR